MCLRLGGGGNTNQSALLYGDYLTSLDVGGVTDSMERMCVDPGEVGSALQAGGVRGPGPPEEENGGAVGIRHWRGIDMKKLLQNVGDGLATTSSHIYARSMYHCALCINHHTDNHNKNSVLL